MNPTSPPVQSYSDEPAAQQQKAFEHMDLAQYGLTAADYPHVAEVMAQLDETQPLSIAEYGKLVARQTQQQTDSLLDMVNNKQLDETGEQLSQVVKLAKQINSHSLLQAPRQTGVLGGLLNRIRGKVADTKHQLQTQFQSTKQQIEGLINEVEQTQNGLKQRVQLLEDMYHAVQHDYHQLGIYVAAGLLKSQQLQYRLAQLTQLKSDSSIQKEESSQQLDTQTLFNLNQVANNLEKRIHDLHILQQSALQTLPMIRIIQNNNTMLIDKFYAIKTITIPAWKNQMSLALSLHEQQNSVALAQHIDQATNDILRRNADLLHQNSVDTARANQRAVIDTATLEYVQSSLFKTVSEVIDIQKQGMQQREQATLQLKNLQQQLSQLVVNSTSAEHTSLSTQQQASSATSVSFTQ